MSLKTLLDAPEILLAPGVFDALSKQDFRRIEKRFAEART